MSELTIRLGSIDDLQAVTALEAACFPPAEAAKESVFQERLAVFSDCFWLMEQDGQLVSMVNGIFSDKEILVDEMFADANIHDPKGKRLMIFGVATLPEKQGMGYATRLLSYVAEDCKKRGKKGLILTCKAHKQSFYGRVGFVTEFLSPSAHGGAEWYQMKLDY